MLQLRLYVHIYIHIYTRAHENLKNITQEGRKHAPSLVQKLRKTIIGRRHRHGHDEELRVPDDPPRRQHRAHFRPDFGGDRLEGLREGNEREMRTDHKQQSEPERGAAPGRRMLQAAREDREALPRCIHSGKDRKRRFTVELLVFH